MGPAPRSGTLKTAATAEATETGMKERGLHSKSNNSTASKTAATGASKMADMPAAAPATRRARRSAAERGQSGAKSEPMAPPGMMIGPAAAKGPPVPRQ